MLRGNAKEDIFFSDTDRRTLLFLLGEGIEKYDHQIHAFCLMKNHIHLLVQVGEVSISKIMHNLAFRYTQQINFKYERVGHLFQGRFKSILIDQEAYFSRLLRYIHMNPVRAHLVNRPEEYYWSSHNAYLQNTKIEWLTVDFGLSRFGSSQECSVENYAAYVFIEETDSQLDELRCRHKNNQVLGNREFVNSLGDKNLTQTDNLSLLRWITKSVCRYLEIDEESIFSSIQSHKTSHARALISIIAKKAKKISIEESSEYLKRSASATSRLLKRFSTKHAICRATQNVIEEIFAEISKSASFEA